MSRLSKRCVLFAALACTAPSITFQDAVHAAAPAGRYTVSGGTVIDSKTKLTWQQVPASSTMTMAAAESYCASSSLSAALGGTGWRLPTVKELLTLVDTSVASPGPTVDSAYFASGPSNVFGSSTLVAHSSTHVWSVIFTYGGVSDSSSPNTALSVRCVR